MPMKYQTKKNNQESIFNLKCSVSTKQKKEKCKHCIGAVRQNEISFNTQKKKILPLTNVPIYIFKILNDFFLNFLKRGRKKRKKHEGEQPLPPIPTKVGW